MPAWTMLNKAARTVVLWGLGGLWVAAAWAQIGCAPGQRGDSPGTSSSACGVHSKHRMGAENDASSRRYYPGDYGYGSGYSRYNAGSGYQPRMERASDILPFLSPGCAQLSEAIRTAPARGVQGDTLTQLREEYYKKCGDEEADIRKQMRDQKRASKESRIQAQASAENQKQLDAREQARCGELKRILVGKRQRIPQMSEGEKNDLQRSEEAYAARCLPG